MTLKWKASALGWIALSIAIATAPAAVAEHWVEARSKHFTVLSDAGAKDAVRLATHFERMRRLFTALLPAQDESSDALPLVVVAVKDRKDMQLLEPAAYLGNGHIDLSGFFLHSVDKDYILVRVDAEQAHAYSTVYHEYTHSVLRKASAWMPLWLNEGLAQFYENTGFDSKTAWIGQANPAQVSLLERNDLLPLATLLTVDASSPFYHDEENGSIFYAESWALTHYLIVTDRLQGTHRMRDYAMRLALGEDSKTAATNAFGDLKLLQDRLTEYVSAQKFMYFVVPEEAAMDRQPVISQIVTEPEADAVRADVMAHTDRTQEADALVETVLQKDAGSVQAQETMGLLRFRMEDFAGAQTWFARAVAADPASYWAHSYLAEAMARRGDRSDAAEIEADLREAIRLNPEFAPAYDALAMFNAHRHRDLKEAQSLAMKAVAIEPGELRFRLDCAEVMAENRHYSQSMGVLRDATHLAKAPSEIAAVHDRMGRVERYQASSAGSTGNRTLSDAGDGAGE